MPGKSAPFTPSSILFRPRIRYQQSGIRYHKYDVLIPEC
jgi:hypothetical protein